MKNMMILLTILGLFSFSCADKAAVNVEDVKGGDGNTEVDGINVEGVKGGDGDTNVKDINVNEVSGGQGDTYVDNINVDLLAGLNGGNTYLEMKVDGGTKHCQNTANCQCYAKKAREKEQVQESSGDLIGDLFKTVTDLFTGGELPKEAVFSAKGPDSKDEQTFFCWININLKPGDATLYNYWLIKDNDKTKGTPMYPTGSLTTQQVDGRIN